MKSMCEREEQVVAALRSGQWAEGLRAHVAECEECAEAALVAGVLLEAEAGERVEVAQGGFLYWKMQLRARREAAAQAVRPIVWAERGAMALGGAGTVWALAWLRTQSETLALVGFGALLVLGAASAGALLLARRERADRR